MAALVRVKRRYDEEPSDTLVLNCKKRKTESHSEANDDVSTVLKFAGTTETQEEDVFKLIRRPTKTELEDQFKKHQVNLNDKLRLEIQAASKNSRYKVVSLHRSNSTDQQENENEVTIVDIESDENKENSAHSNYVYDLYYTRSDDLQEVDVNELISVYPLSSDLVYGSHRDNGYDFADSNDSEDSNAENNWRNDYPDESDMESITEDDMLGAVKNLNLKCDDGLSSDEEEEGFVYSIDNESAGFEDDDVDPSDVRRYGEMYARFKAKVKLSEKANVDHSFYYGDIDEDEY